jgi:glycerol transport system substrate-binding protein
MDGVLADLERRGMKQCPPRLNPKRDPAHYLSSKGAPWSRLADERPPGATIAYEKLLQAWREGRVR